MLKWNSGMYLFQFQFSVERSSDGVDNASQAAKSLETVINSINTR